MRHVFEAAGRRYRAWWRIETNCGSRSSELPRGGMAMVPTVATWLRRFVREDEGQGLVEYGLIILLVSIVSILALTNLGAAIVNMIQAVTAAF